MPDTGSAAPSRTSALSLAAIIVSTIFFATLDSSAKFASLSLPVYEVIWFRYFTNFLLALAIYNPWSAPEAWRLNHPWLQILRALLLTFMTAGNFLALHYLQVADTTSIGFLSPLVIAGLSAIFLKEKIGIRRLIAILVGFSGVLLVTRPGLGGFHPAMLLALMAVFTGAVFYMLTRHLAVRETAGSMVLMLAAVPSLAMLPGLPFFWKTPDTTGLWVLLLFLGVFGGVGISWSSSPTATPAPRRSPPTPTAS